MSEPDLDDDGYPTEATLQTVAHWRHESFLELMEYVRQAWHFGEWGWSETEGDNGSRLFRLSTGGWSGNESLIGALEANSMFWIMCWEQSRRGGHYIFEVKP